MNEDSIITVITIIKLSAHVFVLFDTAKVKV